MKSTFAAEFLRTARQGPRLFFAPIAWAVRGTLIEWRRVERENARCDAEDSAKVERQDKR